MVVFSNNSVHHKRTKHVDVKCNFDRDLVSEKIITAVRIATQLILQISLKSCYQSTCGCEMYIFHVK